MSDTILHKRSLTSGSLPTTASLEVGELAINVPDGKLFLRSSGSNSDEIRSALVIGSNNVGNVQLTGSLTVSGSEIISGSLTVIGGFTASLEQGYAWVGGEGGISVQTPTSSFGGGSGAGFPYIGEAEITGSLDVTDSITTQLFLNPQILNGIILIPVGYNGLLIGPVAAGGELAISSGSTLVTI